MNMNRKLVTKVLKSNKGLSFGDGYFFLKPEDYFVTGFVCEFCKSFATLKTFACALYNGDGALHLDYSQSLILDKDEFSYDQMNREVITSLFIKEIDIKLNKNNWSYDLAEYVAFIEKQPAILNNVKVGLDYSLALALLDRYESAINVAENVLLKFKKYGAIKDANDLQHTINLLSTSPNDLKQDLLNKTEINKQLIIKKYFWLPAT